VSLPEITIATDVPPEVEILALPVTPGENVPPSVARFPAHLPDDLPLSAFLEEVEATGKPGQLHVLPRPGERPRALHLVGIGTGTPADLRLAAAAATRSARSCVDYALALPQVSPDGLAAAVEGALLAGYDFRRTTTREPPRLRNVTVVLDQPYDEQLARVVSTAREAAGAAALARDLVNTPSNEKSPAWLAEQAMTRGAGLSGLRVSVYDEQALRTDGFGGLLAVGAGSRHGPRLIELRYQPPSSRCHIVIIGKGITFDSGGLSLKRGDGMLLMKKDMAGAAAVLAAVLGAASLSLPVQVTALLAAAENMPSGSAQRPGDVIRHYGGRTVEVGNTDAEGRLVLADALAYAAARLAPDVVIDVATLTGAARIALGTRTAALFATEDALAQQLINAGQASGEPLWRFPLIEDYRGLLDSGIADLNNAPGPGRAGSVTAALFLREFTDGLPWAHVDMAAPAWSDSDSEERTKGATGFGARLLLRYLQGKADSA